MSALFRRSSLPGVQLDRDERVLARADTASGVVAATTRRLLLPESDGFRSIDWTDVERATWDNAEQRLTVLETAPRGGRPRLHRVGLDGDTRMLDVIREQVTASVVISRHVPITAERGVRIAGRRRPGQRTLSWVVTPDSGIDLEHPDVRARVEAAVSDVRSEVE